MYYLGKGNRGEDSEEPLEIKITLFLLYVYTYRRTVQALEAVVLNLGLP